MPNVLAMSFEGTLAPSFDMRCMREGGRLPDGWGIGYFPGGEPSASVLKEPAPQEGSIRSELVKAWEHLASSIFVLHLRTATWGSVSDANTQPFLRSFARRDWLFAHSGSLVHRLEPEGKRRFEPVGSTDTELLFCEVLSRIAESGWRSLADVPPDTLHGWMAELNEHGELTTVLTDGRDLCVYADKDGKGPVYLWQLMPPYDRVVFGDEDLAIDLTRRGVMSRKGVILSSTPLQPVQDGTAEWRVVPAGHLVMVRQGAVTAEVAAKASGTPEQPSPRPAFITRGGHSLPKRAEPRRLLVTHRTVYGYESPVERSTHLLRLFPYHDRLQTVLGCDVRMSVDGAGRTYEDVFGNRVRRVLIEKPYTELVIEAASTVELLDTDAMAFRPIHAKTSIPLVWMPWQRHMLQPYLLPPELPESELRELTDYAMSFVERNAYDLLDTLLDLNASIFAEYEYRQGSTNNFTTAFEVYANRQGVCQDFTNLFICLARLLGVPARYVCGYLYTGPRNPNQRQAEASHAWVQVYLPEVGWRGFDPTNGVVTQTDHVRVAVGRNYVDATPTSGTIYVGGGPETLEVVVRVEPVG